MKTVIYSDRDSLTSTQFLEEGLREVFGKNAAITEADRFTLAKDLTPETDLFIVPGIVGETCLYYDHLGGDNAGHIKTYVEKGGVYLGICAGAFQVMTDIRYTNKDGIVLTRKSPFGFIEGYAEGPVDGKEVQNPLGIINGHTAVRPLELCAQFSIFKTQARAIYSSGPAFYPSGIKGTGLARYQDAPKKPIALISAYYGEGLVLGSGTAPYYTAKQYPDINPYNLSKDVYEKAKGLRDTLRSFEKERSSFWNLILQTAAMHRQNLAQGRQAVLAKRL